MLRCLTKKLILTKPQVPTELLHGEKKPEVEVLKRHSLLKLPLVRELMGDRKVNTE